MKTKGKMIARIVLGLMLFVFGLNGFLNFIPMGEMPSPAGNFMGAMVESGYFWPFVKGLEVIAGILLLTGKYIRAALVIAAPIMLNAFLFHLFLAPGGIGGALVALALTIYLISTDWNEGFKQLVKA